MFSPKEMSDKKKKPFPSKESVSPKSPVILKSDRENVKEQPKEKPEREKQPTILIKPREISKEECPQNIKSTQLEADVLQPTKIAQNDHKEKKVIELKVKHMSKPIKLLDEYLEFNNAALDFLSDLSTSYLVIGVIGTQGVGKSTIINLIALDHHNEALCKRILNSHETTDNLCSIPLEKQMKNINIVDLAEDNETKCEQLVFKMQDLDQIEHGVHCTKGIDMYVTKERVILLDCQPLWSPSLLDEGASSGAPRNANSTIVDCLQVASFLMSICHVVVAVQDWFADYNFVKYIQTAEMLTPTISVTNVSSNPEPQESDNPKSSHPHLLLLHNWCKLEDFLPETVRIMQDFYSCRWLRRTLKTISRDARGMRGERACHCPIATATAAKSFQRSSLQLCSGISMYNESNEGHNIDVDQICKGYTVEACGSPINLFLLPEIYEDYDNKEIYRGHMPFEQMARRLRWAVLSATRHQISTVSNLSEKGWLHYCNKAWETIRKCNFFIEYERFLP